MEEKLNRILLLSNEIRQEIQDRKGHIDEEDELWRKTMENFLDTLCTWLPYDFDDLLQQIKKFDETYKTI
jgi:hypothetical protein